MGIILNKIGLYRNGLRFIEEADSLFSNAYAFWKSTSDELYGRI